MVECDPSKVETRVRFPTSARGLGVPFKTPGFAPVTQLVECGAYRFSSILMARRSRGFDPRQEHFAGLAQLVEHQAFNLVVAGSTPAVGSSVFLAPVVEHLSCKQKVLGSSPRGDFFLIHL